jgi:hypothetical protein
VYDLYLGTKDTLVIEIPIDLGGKDLPLEFLICPKKDLKNKMAAFPYLADFVKNSSTKNYKIDESKLGSKNQLMIMSEHDDIANQLIDAKVGEVLLKHGSSGMLQSLHITD